MGEKCIGDRDVANASNFTGNLTFVGNSTVRGSLSLHNLSILSGILTLGNQSIGNHSITSSTTLAPALTTASQSLSNTTPSLTATLQSLTIAGSPNAWTAGLDVTNCNLILQDAVTHNATLATLQNLVNYGRTNSAGIIDSTLSSNFALAVLDNSVTHFSTFGNVAVDTSSILLSPELLGDANADGTVDINDLSTLLNHFGQSSPNWTDGNFNYTSTINLTDLSYVLNNFGLTYAGASTSDPVNSTPAPEPASLAILALSVALVKNRRSSQAK